MGFYSKAYRPRPGIHDPSVRPGNRIHSINILCVEYTGGSIGHAVRDVYQDVKGSGFPTLIEHPDLTYPEPNTTDEAVCNIRYWGAVYVSPNSSNHLSAAIGGGSAAISYNRSDVLTMVWNEARYPTVVDSAISNSLTALSEGARVAYMKANGKHTIKALNNPDPAALAAYSDPWKLLASVNLQPTSRDSRVIYNTLVIILIMIQEFFYLGYVNSLSSQFKIYIALTPHHIIITRQIISRTYTLIGSLCTAGAI
ncbi:unnamed protein product [Penicillium salamii]|nr:unnamed protein product [Penicillium salamii]CAG8327793.1 unnamed protein product [Penicillium salamii]